MRKTAVVILSIGYVFTLFRVEVAGIDLLLDPVGWILVFNGLWGLGKREKGRFRAGWITSLGLVALSAAQLFVKQGRAVLFLAGLNSALQLALFGFMLWDFYKLALREQKLPKVLPWLTTFIPAGAGAVLQFVAVLLPFAAPLPGVMAIVLGLPLVVGLLRLAALFGDR